MKRRRLDFGASLVLRAWEAGGLFSPLLRFAPVRHPFVPFEPFDPFDLTISRQSLAVPPCEAFVLRASGWPVVDWWCEAALRAGGLIEGFR